MSQQVKVISTSSIDAEGTGVPDYSGDFRALISADKPSKPTPYDDFTLQWQFGILVNDSSKFKTWTDSDWGAGYNFYLSNVHIWILAPDWTGDPYYPFFRFYDSQFLIKIENGVTGELLFLKTYTGLDKNVSGYTLDAISFFLWSDTISFNRMKRILVTGSIKITVYNNTDSRINLGYIGISGIPTP